MILQVCFRTLGFEDLFSSLFMLFADMIYIHSINITSMSSFVRARFVELRQRLLDLTLSTPSQRINYKILLVVDEAHNLGKMDFGTFLSQQGPLEPEGLIATASHNDCARPILFPLVHGFCQIAVDIGHFSVVPCETGLSIFDVEWLEDPASFPKGSNKQLGPFTDFGGWESLEQVQTYRDLLRRSLHNDEARLIFDTRVPDVSMAELFERLRGRYRPIVSTLEHMIMCSNGTVDWRLAIKETEDSLSSTELRYNGEGNITFAISRMIQRVASYELRYAKYHHVRDTLQSFVMGYYLHGRPFLIDLEEVPLVEACVGRIPNFALRAAVNYFRQYDPDFHRAICWTLFRVSASVLGYLWDMAVLPSLAHVFHDKIPSKTNVFRKGASSFDPILNRKAEIVGYVNHLTLGTDFRSMSLDKFLDAHVNCGSRKSGKPVPPFYRLANKLPGPDIAFVLRLENHDYCPVFIQLKMRHKISKTETQSAFATVESEAVQGHLQKTTLQTFCTGHSKRFLGVVIAYPAKLADLEGTFPEASRGELIRPAQGEAPQCISIGIDRNNIYDLFPENHMQALDTLQGIKRQPDQVKRGQGSDDQKDEPATKQRRCEDDDSRMGAN
ncbi:hypothetical protein BGZ95_010466 [Linnemannia exigua]|uniref:Uncharacterized protein n=1 Tax=Linnemannia exigua TaxID=604196 RepID=A0AAD4DBD4_9FUNG|nr:hypothetical protein BGZ95_010466 [Linnemannia exigua]